MKAVRHLAVSVLLVMVGVAVGIRYGARFRELLRQSSEKVVCSRRPSAKSGNSRFNREVNADLKRPSLEGTFKCVDLYAALSYADGNLLSAYDSGDGTHLNADGCNAFKRMVSQ